MDNATQPCPVCLGRVPPAAFNGHMASHTKDEVLAALLRQNTSGLIRTPTPLIMPQMPHMPQMPQIPQMPQMPLGMSMVMSPVLIPQQNGPPIIFNVPSYVYPNLLSNASTPTTPSTTATTTASMVPLEAERPRLQDEPLASSSSSSTRSSEVATSVVGSPKPGPSSSQSEEVQKICTVETINDLKDAQMLLKTDEDVQIVVAHNLLETNEFKSFMSHLNLPSSQNTEHSKTLVPPNTRVPSPATILPSTSASKDYHDDDQDQDISLEEEDEALEEEVDEDLDQTAKISDSDDDICLQDLVAMETMDDNDDSNDSNVVIEEDDQVFTIASCRSTNLEPSFVDAILSDRQSETFECDSCGLHFPTHESYHNHRVDHCKKKCRNGLKVKRSTTNSNLEVDVKSEASSLLSSADLLNANNQPSTSSGFKSEFDSQPALGSINDNQWKCHQCLKIFSSGVELFAHQEQLNKAEHKCMTCHVILEDRAMVLAHKKEFHSVNQLKIKMETSEENSLVDVKDVFPNENGEYVCDKCDRAFKDKELMIKHMSCHDEAKPFECLECGKKFSKAVFLRDHRKRHFEKGDYECSLCHKRFHTPSKLREHVRVHTGEAPLICKVCGKGFKRHSNLSEHKRIHDENRPVKPTKELFCHCGQMFKTKRELDWHVEEVHERVPKKCTHCGEVFVHSTSLTRHIRRRHQKDYMPDDKKASLSAKCPICHQTFYKTSINKHIRIKHEGQKPYQCEICKMGFVTKNNLENHQWQHKHPRARPFKCQLCNKAYLRQSQLEAHMRAHRGVKPFVCNDCGLQFSNKSNWQRHVAEHTGERKFACPHCNKKFSRSYYLTDHLKVHTGIKPYSCQICGKTAATRSNHNSHLRTHITREPVNSEV